MGKLLIRNLGLIFLMLMLAVALGVLTGCEGDDGIDGKSAYEIAVDNGFEGTEQEWLDSLAAQVPEMEESCNVCHGTDGVAGLEINVVHPEPREKPVVSNIVVARSAGDVLTVTFDVTDNAGTPITGIGLVDPSSGSDLRVYIADIVPAGTPTGNVPQSTWGDSVYWPTGQLEIWAAERGNNPGVVISEPVPGSYSFVMAATPPFVGAGTDAPEGDLAHTQRIYVRADPRDFGVFNRTMGVADFTMPAAGADTGVLVQEDTATGDYISRTVVVPSACTACHGDPLERAGHGGGYQSPQVCLLCHSPIGTYGYLMQDAEAWLASLIHKIHAAIDMPAFPDRIGGRGYGAVTYPKNIKDCEVCHFDDGQDLAFAWQDNPTIEVCSTCHINVDFETGDGHAGGAQANNAGCRFCHPASGDGFGQSVAGAHEVTTLKRDPSGAGGDIPITPNYTASITLSDDANDDGVYEAGEAILVTVTASNAAAGDYTDPEGPYSNATVYVYGPRAEAVPVLTPGSTTDPDYDPASGAPDQGRSMLISAAANDAQVETDDDGFKYQLFAIPADLAEGTYMVQARVTALADCSGVYRGNTCIDGWTLTTFQVGTDVEELKVAGECTDCHTQADWGTMYHRSYFGTDGCIACHDLSGNFANYLSNRVHAVHDACPDCDLKGPVPEWADITFPRNDTSCEACHNSGNESFVGLPAIWGPPCFGCHGDEQGVRGHMQQNGSNVEYR
jgi:OmcA/MtrC family decaheme c-type cytochrome